MVNQPKDGGPASSGVSRRDVLKQLGAAGTGLVVAGSGSVRGQGGSIDLAGQSVEIAIRSLSAHTVRITILPRLNGIPQPVATTGALEQQDAGTLIKREQTFSPLVRSRAGALNVELTATESGEKLPDPPPPSFPWFLRITHAETGQLVQRLGFDRTAPGMSFLLPTGPLLGLGEGGPQFDRKGSVDTMRNGQGGYQLATHGTRAPVQWLIGTTDGWAMFIHQPYGQFDFTDPAVGRFTPQMAGGRGGGTPPAPSTFLPLDVFIVGASDPKVVMREYARITGLPEMPAKWTLGYM